MGFSQNLTLADFTDNVDLKIINANICVNPRDPWESKNFHLLTSYFQLTHLS